MPRIKIKDQIERSVSNNSVGITGAANEQEYKVMNTGSFLIGADIQNKGMSYAFNVAGVAPVITPTPPGAPALPSDIAVLSIRYDDKVRTWERTAGVWSWAYDMQKWLHIERVGVRRMEEPVTAAVAPLGQFFVTPSTMDNWTTIYVALRCFSGAGTCDVDVYKNGAVVATQAGVNSGASIELALGIVTNTGDTWSFRTFNPVGALFGLSAVIVYDPNV